MSSWQHDVHRPFHARLEACVHHVYVSHGLFRRLLRGVEAYECLEKPCQNRNTKDPA